MIRRSKLAWPIIIGLGVVILSLLVALLVIWIIGQANAGQWWQLVAGTVLFAIVLPGVVGLWIVAIKEGRLSRRQGGFIDSVTHELKSPIASIKLYLQTLDLREVSPEQQREFLKFMLEDVQRLDSLIDHLLAAAQLGEGEPQEGFQEVPLNSIVNACADTVRRRYGLDMEQIRIELPQEGQCVVQGSEQDLQMVFSNLLDNAVKYGGEIPQAVLRVQALPGGTVRVSISDNGKGVRFEFRRRIFERFYRGGSELERTTKGTGLGLYIVRSLVRRMKGSVSVHGRGPLAGATFDVELPGRLQAVEANLAAAGKS